MALTDGEAGGIPATMLVGPTNMPYPVYQNGNGNNGFGGDNGWWIVLLILIFAMGGWNNNCNNGGYGFGGQPIILNDGNNGNAIQRGFDQAAVMSGITGVQTGINNLSTQLCGCCADVQQSLCNGFAGVNSTVNSGFANAETAANARQMANMNQTFAAQTAMSQGFNNLQSQFADCCCENRLASADLKYTIATENCADRAALSDGIRDIIQNQTASTQRILDQLCQDKIDAKNDEIAQLRQEILYARGQASQVAQNSTIINGVYDRLNQCPVGTVPVYGEQPIFTCPNNNSCGCGCSNF
jgi:hypothetical protein